MLRNHTDGYVLLAPNAPRPKYIVDMNPVCACACWVWTYRVILHEIDTVTWL